MRELEKKLKELQKLGYEQVTIIQVQNWISDIRWQASVKKLDRGNK